MNPLTFIHAMVAPAVMISACGLLLLSLNNKYSLVVNRIRLLNAEFRSPQVSDSRRKCIKKQIKKLKVRMLLLKNSVLLYTVSVIFTVLTMIFIAAKEFFNLKLHFLIVFSFVLGVIFLLIGSLFAAREAILGYKIVADIEIKSTIDL